MEVSEEILQSTVVEDRQDAPPTLVIPPMPEMGLVPEEEESIYRPHEVLESFDISHRRAIDEEDLEPEEGSLQEDMDDTILDERPIQFEVLEKGSKRGGKLLVASDGFTYGVKRENKTSTAWTCAVRSTKMRCHATVLQKGDFFVRGPAQHCHPGDLKLPVLKKISSKAKEIARQQVFRQARDIVEKTVADQLVDDQRFLAPKSSNVKRQSTQSWLQTDRAIESGF